MNPDVELNGWVGADRRRRPEPSRAAGDHDVSYQLALAAQDLLDAILGEEPFTLAEVAPLLARLGEGTSAGHPLPWTAERVLARCRELDELYNPPPELGGDIIDEAVPA